MGDSLKIIKERVERKGLVKGFKTNDGTTLKMVYNRMFPKVLAYIMGNNGSEAQAKDIFQEAFVACWKNIKADKLPENGNVEAYLYTIAKNKWMDHLRSSAHKKTVSGEKVIALFQAEGQENPMETHIEKNEDQLQIMQAAFKKLGEGCRSILTKFYFERSSMDDISKEMNIGAASARNKKYRCMEKLRALTLEIRNHG